MGNKIKGAKAIAGALKRMEKQPNNEFPVDGSLRCEVWQNHLNTSDPGPQHLDSYTATS